MPAPRALSPFAAALALSAAFALAPGEARAAETGRLWIYAAGNLQLTPEWTLTLMPGLRYEFERSGAPAKEHYLDEVFVGPSWSRRWGDLGFKLSLWYYFLGYPRPGSYPVSHNLELIPTVDYQIGALNLSYRAIFHNTFYASVYPGPQRWGFGTVMRNLVLLKYRIVPSFSLLLGDEPWFGILENAGTGTKYNSAGYWQSGLRLNRLYAGLDWKIAGGLALSPQYIFETTFGPNGQGTETGHYVFVTVSYTHKAF
ncbi:MAG TPA: hypothetical protein VGK67_33660 [Myxococcales bacterium]|jgi:hypothetical protein